MLTLTILHNIFLTKQDRSTLVNGGQIQAMGVSVPVWYLKGKTTEPAQEIFCEYILTNTTEDYPLTALAKGYKINLPQTPPGQKTISKISKQQLDEMSMAEQSIWLQKNPNILSTKDLLESEQPISFKRYDKVTNENQRMNIIHTVEINDIEKLTQSLPVLD